MTNHEIPSRISVLFSELIAFRKDALYGFASDVAVSRKSKECSGFLKVHYHNKDIEMIDTEQ